MEFSAMAAIPNGGNGKGKAVFTVAEVGVHSLSTFARWSFTLVDTLIPVVVVSVMIINVVIAVVIVTVSGPGYYDGNRFRVRGSQSEQS
jgi:hypothetical protein